jgi:hypothetical protein
MSPELPAQDSRNSCRNSHGALGDPRSANADMGERLLSAAANVVAKLVANQEFWNFPA